MISGLKALKENSVQFFFLMTECSKRNRKNYQTNKKSHARITLDHGLALVGLRTTGPMPKNRVLFQSVQRRFTKRME